MPFVRGHRRSRTQSEIDPLTACGVTKLPSQPLSSHSLSKDVVAVACSSHNFDSFRTSIPSSIPNKTPSTPRNSICSPAVSVSLKINPSLATIPEPQLVVIDLRAAAPTDVAVAVNVKKISPVKLIEANESGSDSKCLTGKDVQHAEQLRLFRFPHSFSLTSTTSAEVETSGNVISLSQSTTSTLSSSIIFPISSIKATKFANSSYVEKVSQGGDVNLSAEFSSDHGTTQVRDVARLTEERSCDQEEIDDNDVNALLLGEEEQQQQQQQSKQFAQKSNPIILKNHHSLSSHETSLVNEVRDNKLIIVDKLITKLELKMPEASYSSPIANYPKINHEPAGTSTSLSKLLIKAAAETDAKTIEITAEMRQQKKTGILLMVEKSLKRRLNLNNCPGSVSNSMKLGQEEFKKPLGTPVLCKFPASYDFCLSNNYWVAARSPSIVA